MLTLVGKGAGNAEGYYVVAIPLAAGVLYPNFVLSPALEAVLMVERNDNLLRRGTINCLWENSLTRVGKGWKLLAERPAD